MWQTRYLLLGAGKSSLSLARFLGSESLCLTEVGSESVLLRYSKDKQDWEELTRFPGKFESHPWKNIQFENAFISPGIDSRRVLTDEKIKMQELRELDFFRENFKGRIFAVTGTNGKSTASFQLAFLFQRIFGEEQVFVGGNLGTPMFDLFHDKPQANFAVLEVSSYQAERLRSKALDWALLLNLSPDHLDRYASLEDYFAAKWHLLECANLCFFPSECLSPDGFKKTSQIQFSADENLSEVLRKIIFKLSEEFPNFRKLEEDVAIFKNLPRLAHRLEAIKVRPGLKVINDSKATNVSSVLYALRQIRSEPLHLHLILGGKAKGDDFSILLQELRESDHLWIYGMDREKIRDDLKSFKGKIQIIESFEELITQLFQSIQEASCILLSPGCASFDQFRNFEERGNLFRQKALELLS